MTLTSPVLLYMCLVSLVQLYIYHLILPLSTLSRDLDIHYIHYVTLISMTLFSDHIHWATHHLSLTLINEINQAGITGGDYNRRNSGRCAWKGDPLWVWDATHDFVIYARSCYYMLHDTWVQLTISPYYQDLLTHHLFDVQLSCGMGHRMVALVRVIKHAKYIHLHYIPYYLWWFST